MIEETLHFMTLIQKEKVLEISRAQTFFGARDLESKGISRNCLYTLCKEGVIQKTMRGLYTTEDANITENVNLVEVVKYVPRGVICLISALSFYSLSTQIPHEIWIAIPRGSWRPHLNYPRARLTFLSEPYYSFGIRTEILEGIPVKIYSPAKTVADCFKFRNKIGLDIAIEALREVLRSKQATVDELTKAAKVCRVRNIMRPYVEAFLQRS